MSGETLITIVGNLTADPELRWTQSGVAVADFTVASTPRAYDRNAGEWRDGDTLFMRCSVWRETAENVAESLRKGMRVIVQGRLTQRSYETQQGERRTVVEMQVDEVGPSLRRARAQVTRHPAADGGAGYPPPPPPASTQPTQQAPQAPQAPQQPAPEDPWARQGSQPAAGYTAWEPPF
jgi:single-strand DNA-binding protein